MTATKFASAPKPLNLGLMGCGNIARQFTAAVAGSAHVKVVAAASRDIAKAQDFANTFNIDRAYGSYEALLADKAIDIVYVPLPNSMHLEWVVKAVQAGKHVLSEKPLALTLQEAQAMFQAAKTHGVMLLEAYPYWFQPQTRDLVQLISSGAIGTVRNVHASFGFNLMGQAGVANNIRMKADLGGGALLDAGSYAMSLIRLAMGDAPERVIAHKVMAQSGVDISTSATLFFSGGRTAQLFCAMNVGYHRIATILGDNGAIETEFLNHTAPGAGQPSPYLPSMLRVRRGFANSTPFEDIASASGSGFAFCAEAFSKVIREKDFAAIDRAAKASCDIAHSLQAMAQSARMGLVVNLAS